MADFAHTISLDTEGRVSTLRFESDHSANVFTLPMLQDLADRIAELGRSNQCRVLVIKGRDDLFSGGADLTSIQAMEPSTYRLYIETEYRLFRQIELLPFITIASIAGACVGNAAELALACDLRIASERARLGWPELNVAFDAPAQRLARFLGIGQLKEILFSARLLTAEEAKAAGLLTKVVPHERLEAETRHEADRYGGRPPIGIRLTKENIERAYDFSTEDSTLEIHAASEAFATQDFQEGVAAVLARRAPDFSGR